MRDMAMKHGLFLPQGFTGELAGFQDPAAAWEALTSYAQAADASGYETIWVADHLHNAMGTQDPLFECWTTTAALLRDTLSRNSLVQTIIVLRKTNGDRILLTR